MAHVSEPGKPAGNGNQRNNLPDAYSAQPGDTQNPNRVAQADATAAHHAEANQNVSGSRSTKSRSRTEETHAAKIVQEENESRNKFPKYPGLERWELLEKMGDGAFSNVYRAKDLTGDAGEVAIKVVRKFEMNNMQVSSLMVELLSPTMSFLCFIRQLFSCFQQIIIFPLPTLVSNSRATRLYIRILRRFRRQQRCGVIPFHLSSFSHVSSLRLPLFLCSLVTSIFHIFTSLFLSSSPSLPLLKHGYECH